MDSKGNGRLWETEVSHVCTEGTRSRKENRCCEDVIYLRETERFLFCGLADGQSGTKYGAEGGRACLEAVFEYMDSAGIGKIVSNPFPDELPCAFVTEFRRKLLSLAEIKKVSYKEFASTLLVLAVERETGKYILLHLGDGCAISIPRTGEPTVLSGPDVGLTAYHTWLTTSGSAVAHLRVLFGTVADKERLLLLSDGAVCFCRGRNIPWRTKEQLCRCTGTKLKEILIQSKPVDDAACIVVDIRGVG